MEGLGPSWTGEPSRRDSIDLSGIAVLDPRLTLLPEIEPNGMMHMADFFPSVPKQVNFDLLYQPVNGQWRLFGISLNVGPSGPVAPQPAQTQTAAKPPKAEVRHKPHAKKPEPQPSSEAAPE